MNHTFKWIDAKNNMIYWTNDCIIIKKRKIMIKNLSCFILQEIMKENKQEKKLCYGLR